MHPDLTNLGDTFYTGPCTNVNADSVLKLQHYQDTYISHHTKLAVKRPAKLHIDLHLKSSNYVQLEPVLILLTIQLMIELKCKILTET